MAKHLAESSEQTRQPPIWRTKIALSAVLMVAVTVLTVLGFRWLTSDHHGVPESTFTVENADPVPSTPEAAEQSDTEELEDEELIVHVAGEVHHPGIVELPKDSRAIDAIAGAGGPTDAAQLDALNLAAPISDGEYILVPHRDNTNENEPQPPGAAGTPFGGGTSVVNINTADTTALEMLPGVGPATAAKIISHREQHGPFTQLADLQAVSGIGPATLERLDGMVSW